MTLNFYTLGVIYLVYSFLGWVAETVVATIRGGRFANRGAAAGPFCFIYGTTGVLLAVSFGDLRTEPVYLFFACMMAATAVSYTHLRAHETRSNLVCRLLLEKIFF